MKIIEKQVGDYLLYCERVRGMTEATLVQKRNVLTRFVQTAGISDLQELDNAVVNQWVEYNIGKGASAQSVNAYNAVVVAMVRYYRAVGVEVPVNLSLVGKLNEMSGQRRFYTASEIEVVVAKADFEVGLAIRIMFETGMRIAELVRLRVCDFEPGFCGRRVRFMGKGRKLREAYVTLGTSGLVRKYVRENGIVSRYGNSGYLWSAWGGRATLNGEPPTVNTMRVYLKRAFAAAGFDGFYPHALRHSFATDLQLRGASVAEIKEMIGHSSIATTERYLHGFEGRLKELFDKYR